MICIFQVQVRQMFEFLTLLDGAYMAEIHASGAGSGNVVRASLLKPLSKRAINPLFAES